MSIVKDVEEHLKNWKPPSAEEVKKSMCKVNLSKPSPKKCPKCKSKYLYFDPMAGPIVGGVGTWKHPPNAHPMGAWICLDCAMKNSKKVRVIEREQRMERTREMIKQKAKELRELKVNLKELEGTK